MAKSKKIRGAGDVISKIAEAVGIKECDGCSGRKDFLNLKTIFPFKKVIPMSQEDKELFLNNPTIETILELYERNFSKKIEIENLTSNVLNAIINDLSTLSDYEN